jgi:protein-S-isoprenylcysteine O-methyltransferase Ste14
MPDALHTGPRALITLLWVAWALYWLISAWGVKAVQRRESLGSRLAHVLPLIVAGVLLGWSRMPWAFLTQRLWPRSWEAYWMGVALLAASIAFAVWARVHLGRNWSGTVTVKQDHELIRSGPYALVRHPIYTGLLGAVLGTAFASGTVRAALAFVIITIALVRKLRTEETFMRETFPGEYQRYSAQVPALIPFTKPRRSAPH